MFDNLPSDRQEVGNLELEYSLRAQAGLTNVGVDEDGELQWQGTDKQWREYEKLVDLEEFKKE